MYTKKIHSLLLILAIVFFNNLAYSQVYNTNVEAKINLQSQGEVIQITGSALNKTSYNQSLRYVLSVIKNNSNNGNQSKNDQSGRFVLEFGEKKNLSTTVINTNEKDRIIILLLVYDEKDSLLGMDRIVINGNEEDVKLEKEESEQKEEMLNDTPDATQQGEDGFVIKGVVIEETKTKPGRDFFKMFYSLYSRYEVNGEEIVTVKEVLSLNNNTKIEIFVAKDKVVDFFVTPQYDYLKKMSDTSIRTVYLYLRKYKQNKSLKKYY